MRISVRTQKGSKVLDVRGDRILEIVGENTESYLKTIEYMYLGVMGVATGDIESLKIECPYTGVIEKRIDKVLWGLEGYVPLSTVVYKVSREGGIEERLCYAEELSYNRGDFNVKGKNKELYEEEEKGIKEKEKLIKLSAILLAKSELDYMYKLEKGCLKLVRKSTGEYIEVEDIKEDDEYYALKLLGMQIQKKRKHLGVLIIDGKGMSKGVLLFFKEMQSMLRGNNYNIFTYGKNIEFDEKELVTKIELP